jgi:hypothetical protein
MHPFIRLACLALILAPCSFSALGISGSGIEYRYDGSRFSAVAPACAINVGGEPVQAEVRSSDPCIRAVFPSGCNTTVIAAGGEECIGLELACDANATSVGLTVIPTSGMVRGGVVRTARISYDAPAVAPRPANGSAGQANGTMQNGSGPRQPAAGTNAETGNGGQALAGQQFPGAYVMVLILVVVIASVSVWYLAKHHSRR